MSTQLQFSHSNSFILSLPGAMLALPWSILVFAGGKTGGRDWLDKCIGFCLKYMGHLGKIQFSFPFPSLPLDYFDVQDLKILLGIISFEIIAAGS